MVRPRSLLLPLSLTLAALLGVAPTLAQSAPEAPQKSFGEVVRATAVTVTIEVRDASGAVPAVLTPGDFVVLEDGKEMPVLAVEPTAAFGDPSAGSPAPAASPEVAAPTAVAPTAPPSSAPAAGQGAAEIPRAEPWQVVLYFDGPTASIPTVQGAAKELASQAARLVALGSVEVVVASPSPTRVAGPTRDAAELAAALGKIDEEGVGTNDLARFRREFVAASDSDTLDEWTRSRADPTPRRSNTPGQPPPQGVLYRDDSARGTDNRFTSGSSGLQRRMLIQTSAQREFQLLARQRTLMTDWLALVERPRRPHALVFVSDGFDLDPTEFYLSYLRDSTLVSQTRSDLERLGSASGFEEMTRMVAAAGWQVMPISLGQPGGQTAGGADASGRGRFRGHTRDARSEASGAGLSQFLLRAPIDPLQSLAEASGGDLSLSPEQIDLHLAGLADRVRLTYQVPRDADGALHALEVRSRRADWTVRAPTSVSTASPDAMMAARARHVLGAGDALGSSLGLAAEVKVVVDPNQPEAELLKLSYDVDLTSLRSERAALDAGELRVTLAVELPDGRVLVSQSRPKPRDLSSDFHYVAREPLRVPKGTRRLAVAVDDTATGAWGAASVEPGG
ncbi:MAG: hypothetical protein KDB94_11845 [Acidobacteria bacterium]|nr:hypothetical protein [Acidobacteriota bacterium]